MTTLPFSANLVCCLQFSSDMCMLGDINGGQIATQIVRLSFNFHLQLSLLISYDPRML